MLTEDEQKKYFDLDNDYLLKLIIERNTARDFVRDQFENFKQTNQKLIESLRVKANELATRIAERRNQPHNNSN